MDKKKNAFVKGHNVLKGKTSKPISKIKEVEKKKAEELETAAVLNEYIQDFTAGTATGKTFVRAGVVNPDKSVNQDMVAGAGKMYKPKSKMQELAEEFKKSKAITEEYKKEKEDNIKKKSNEKKKSNLELFKEELQQSQKEREIRHKIKKGDMTGITDEMLQALPPTFFNAQDDFRPPPVGSHDTGDPQTTNLFVSNLNPKMNEEMLCKVFGKYGPLASVKIMWPRSEEEKSRNRNCGFVAFMNRKDGDKALADIEGKDVMEYEMKIGWGKAVPIPPTPIYIHPTQQTKRRPPKQSGHPFNCQIPYKQRKAGIPFDYNLENTIVKVVIPQERSLLSLINRMVEFVVREGPMFEAMIMNREISNPMFRFLFDNKSNEHTYYRWRVYSILQGDTPSKWEQDCFHMFAGGSLWQPPSMNPYGQPSLNMGASALNSAVIASISSANAHNESNALPEMEIPSLMSQAIKLPEVVEEKDEKAEKRSLNDKQRDKLEDLLRTVTTDRYKVGELMTWCIDHADCSGEIIECICESLSILETPIPTKIARMFVVSDILHNSAAKVPYASHYRTGFQDSLMEVSDNLHKALASCSTKLQAEKFRKQVLSCLAAWQDWAIYPPAFLINLQNVFVGISDAKSVKDPLVLTNDEAIPFSKEEEELADEIDEDLDGDPLLDPDLDGIPLGKDMELDGEPLDAGADVLFSSRWTDPKNAVDDDDPLSKSRWEKGDDEEEKVKEPLDSSKWAKVGENKKDEQKEQKVDKTLTDSPIDSKKKSNYQPPPPIQDESRRKFLREVEVKVMRFVDKLEQRGGTRSGLNIQAEAEKFRQQLIDEYDMARQREARRKTKSDRKRDRSSSPSDVPRKKKSSKRGRSSSSDSSSDSENDSSKRKSRSKKRGSGTPRDKSHKSKDRYRSTSPTKRSSRRSSQSPGRSSPRRYSRSPPSRRSSGSPSPNRPSSSRRNSKSPARRSSRSPRRSSRSPYRRSSFSPARNGSRSRSPTPRSVGSPFGTPRARSRSPYMDISPNDRDSLSPQRSPARKRSAKNSPAISRIYDSPARSSSKKKKSKKSKR